MVDFVFLTALAIGNGISGIIFQKIGYFAIYGKTIDKHCITPRISSKIKFFFFSRIGIGLATQVLAVLYAVFFVTESRVLREKETGISFDDCITYTLTTNI